MRRRATATTHAQSGDVMADITTDTIVCRLDADAGQWLAYFEHAPQVAFGSDLPMGAVRRLLEGTEAASGGYPLVCDADRARTGVLQRELIWQPPEIVFACPSCNGSGQYVGLIDVETCKVCGGRKVVSA